METATPGVKSTGDGWLNRYLQARSSEGATPFRAVALTPQLPRMLQGTAPALAVSQIGQFGIRGGQTADVGASFEAQYAAAADRVLNGTGREAFDAMKMLKVADPTRYEPEHGADYPRSPFGQALKQIAQLTKANVGLEVAFAELGGWDTHVNQGAAQGQLAARLDDFAQEHRRARRSTSAIAWTTPSSSRCRSSAARSARTAIAAPITGTGTRCWSSAAACGAAASTAAGPASRRTSGTKVATSPSRPTSATSSPRSSCDTSASQIRGPSFRDTPSTPRDSRECWPSRTLGFGDL